MKFTVKWPVVLFLLSITTVFAAESPDTQAEVVQPDKTTEKSQIDKAQVDDSSAEAEPDCD